MMMRFRVLLLVLAFQYQITYAFHAPGTLLQRYQRQQPSLTYSRLAARRGQPSATSSKKKQTKTKNTKKQKNATDKGSKLKYRDQMSPREPNPANNNNSNKRTKTAPPWQTLNAKQAKQNVQREIARRSADAPYSPTTDTPAPLLSRTFLSETHARLYAWNSFSMSTIDTTVEFKGSYIHRLPESLGVPEVAFLGRSNVGKSSLLNRLAKTNVARVGKTPGATASVNLYGLCERKQQKPLLGLVDLPGFGYAKLSKELKEDIGKLAEVYLSNRLELAVGILLVDIRRIPTDDDRAILAALYDASVPVMVVATKLDKLPNEREQTKQLEIIRDTLGLPEGQPLAVSSVTGDGCRLLWRIIMEACEDHVRVLNRNYVEEHPDDDDEEPSSTIMDEEVFVDHEDIAYEQGYDWIHGSALYEEDLDDGTKDASQVADEALPSLSEINNDKSSTDVSKMKLQDWHRKSVEMERDGLL